MEALVRYIGCLLGVAIGDALGYPVEFQRHGPFIVSGMTSPWYSDDTQMTLATTDGLIKSKETGNPTAEVYREYLRWLDSQSDPSQRRAPGGTCKTINCPSCGKRLNVPRQGKFACPVCRVGMSFDREGKVALV